MPNANVFHGQQQNTGKTDLVYQLGSYFKFTDQNSHSLSLYSYFDTILFCVLQSMWWSNDKMVIVIIRASISLVML